MISNANPSLEQPSSRMFFTQRIQGCRQKATAVVNIREDCICYLMKSRMCFSKESQWNNRLHQLTNKFDLSKVSVATMLISYRGSLKQIYEHTLRSTAGAFYLERPVCCIHQDVTKRWQWFIDLSGEHMECTEVWLWGCHHLSCFQGESQPLLNDHRRKG